MHLKVIELHAQEKQQEPPSKLACCKRHKVAYVNKFPIDAYIDKWWLCNCPSSKSTKEHNESVYKLIHELFMLGLDHEEEETHRA